MDCFTEDLWAIILSRLPLKIITTSKLVCKQWKSIVESPYFRDLFQSVHQNSHSSSWSLMSCDDGTEFVAHYRCNTWELERSLGSYISSFLTNKFKTQRVKYKVWSYTDVGLILISEANYWETKTSLYVASPVSQECVQIPSRKEYSEPQGIVTRTEIGVFLDYKVVLRNLDECSTLLIYSSETGLWSLISFPLSLSYLVLDCPISLDGNIHWLASDSRREDFVASLINVYSTGTGSVQSRITPFPDLGKRLRFKRTFTACQGFLMYMNIFSVPKADGSLEDKLCVWRLTKSGEWQLVSEAIPSFIETGFEYFPFVINPFDAISLCNGIYELHGELKRSRDGHILSSVECRHRITLFLVRFPTMAVPYSSEKSFLNIFTLFLVYFLVFLFGS